MSVSVLIGMSGGVDSASSAALLLKSGYNVTGVYLIMTPDDSADSDSARDAAECAATLGIPFFTADRRSEFSVYVRDYFIDEYLHGRTPNPCIVCNPLVKFKSLCEVADKLGFGSIATGHYAVIRKEGADSLLCRSPSKKDQSYFLYRLNQSVLSRLILPLGEFRSKDEIREYALTNKLPVAKKKDSLEICFIKDGDYSSYISNLNGQAPAAGDFLDTDGRVIGKHRGIIYYTPGQRKGLGAFGKPMYVRSINPSENTVTLCTEGERYSRMLTAQNAVWIQPDRIKDEFDCEIKVRSTAVPAKAHVHVRGDSFTAEFENDVLAVSAGQSAVLYDGDIVLGGGFINTSR